MRFERQRKNDKWTDNCRCPVLENVVGQCMMNRFRVDIAGTWITMLAAILVTNPFVLLVTAARATPY